MTSAIPPEEQPQSGADLTAPENSPEQLHQEWLDDLPELLSELEREHLPEDFPFDYTSESLSALEDCLLAYYDPEQPAPTEPRFLEGAMAYLGEVLLGAAGGCWGWHTRPVQDFPGQPVVCPDPDLGLSPVAPLLLIGHAGRIRTGTAFAKEIERLRTAVAELREQSPDWSPQKAHTPGVDPDDPKLPHPGPPQ